MAHTRPLISGILTENGKAIPGAELFTGKYPTRISPCAEVGEPIAMTVSSGRFFLTPRDELKLTDLPFTTPRQRLSVTALCIKHPQRGMLIGSLIVMPQDQPMSVNVECELARRYEPQPGAPTMTSPLAQPQHCVVTRLE